MVRLGDTPRPAQKKVGFQAEHMGDSPSLDKPITCSPSLLLKTAQIKAAFPRCCLQPVCPGGKGWTHHPGPPGVVGMVVTGQEIQEDKYPVEPKQHSLATQEWSK